MSITILDAINLESLKSFKLIAGKWGMNKSIEKVGILDYEFDSKISEQFGEGDFVISSFLFAKDNVNLLIEAIKNLIDSGVECLAIKNIYYKELPDEIVEYANKKSFPIFLFDKRIFFEDIITSIMDTIKEADNYQLLEAKVDMIIRKNMSKSVIRRLALEINSSFKENFIVVYCKQKKYREDVDIIRLLEEIKRIKNISISTSILKYKRGIMLISSYDSIEERNIKNIVYSLISNIKISTEEFSIGVSNLYNNLNELDKGINESIYSLRTGQLLEENITYFNNIGIYKILMPFIDESWVQDFSNNIILPLKNHDEKYNTEIFNTAIKYVENGGNIKKTAEDLYQHENTIRYRINKMKEILNIKEIDNDLHEQISIAVKIYKIMKNEL